MTPETLRLMARFNAWANARLYGVVAGLSAEAYGRERGTFFPSVHRLLNHLLVVDRLWTGRLVGEDHGAMRLDDVPCPDFATLRAARQAEDVRFIRVAAALDAAALAGTVTYRRMLGSGTETVRRDHLLLGQLYHQTHHRGQVVALLNQDGIEPPPLDVIFYLDEQGLSG